MPQRGVSLLELVLGLGLMLTVVSLAAPSYPRVADQLKTMVTEYRDLIAEYLEDDPAPVPPSLWLPKG